jgi:hypothetical protein
MNVAIKIFSDTILLASNEISYGGSLDAQTIFNTAKSLKININNLYRIYDKNKHGLTLIDIRQKRNWLAHGEKTFIEVGSTSSYTQLKEAKEYVFSFLNEYITSFDSYITNQNYKKISTNHLQSLD